MAPSFHSLVELHCSSQLIRKQGNMYVRRSYPVHMQPGSRFVLIIGVTLGSQHASPKRSSWSSIPELKALPKIHNASDISRWHWTGKIPSLVWQHVEMALQAKEAAEDKHTEGTMYWAKQPSSPLHLGSGCLVGRSRGWRSVRRRTRRVTECVQSPGTAFPVSWYTYGDWMGR